MELFWRNAIRGILVLVGLAPIIVVIYFALNRSLTKEALMLLVGAELATLLFSFGLVVLHAIVTDQIRLDSILNEQTGEASVSRFQLLIFTFTIALTLVYLTLCGNGQFPAIPKEVLILLGISATTYGVGKGLQLGLGSNPPSGPAPPPAPAPGLATPPPAPPAAAVNNNPNAN
jgi:hypothetical protein